jgi:hypothetical protein
MTPEQMTQKIQELEYRLNRIERPDRILLFKDTQHTGTRFGFFSTPPVVQHSATGAATGMVVVGGTAVEEGNRFSGNTGSRTYTIHGIVRALKDIGILAP